jgi:ribonuclease HI
VAIVAGDLTETRTADDRRWVRLPGGDGNVIARPKSSRALHDQEGKRKSLIEALCTAGGFTDTVRVRHPRGGFTCGTPLANDAEGARRTESRIDYVLVRDTRGGDDFNAMGAGGDARIAVRAAAVLSPSPFGAWPSVKHLPVLALLRGAFAFDCRTDTPRARGAPRTRVSMQRATVEDRQRAASAMTKLLLARGDNGDASLAERARELRHASCDAIDAFTTALVAAATIASTGTLPVSGGARRRAAWPKWILTIRRLRLRFHECLIRVTIDIDACKHDHRVTDALLRATAAAARCWHLARERATVTYGIALPNLAPMPHGAIALQCWLRTAVNALHDVDYRASKAFHLRVIEEREATRRLPDYDPHAPAEQQPRNESDLKRALKGVRQAPITAVVMDGGEVKRDPKEVAEVFCAAYERTFAASERKESERPVWWEKVIGKPKDHIDERWYDGLMAPISEHELRAAVHGTDWLSAAGHDDIGAGVWRAFIEESKTARDTLCEWASACIAARHRPAHGAVIVFQPIGKGKGKQHRTVAETRPIALQATLTKLVSKVLARRLSTIFARHPILHEEQRAFVRGGGSHHCVTALLDVCERARAEHGAAYFLFYDLKGAFDTVRHDDIAPALRRLKVPAAYIAWVASSLAELRGTVRISGESSREFGYHRGVPQGGPESPLWFVVVLDTLLTGLHQRARDDNGEHNDRCLHRLPRSDHAGGEAKGEARNDAASGDRGTIVGCAFADDVAVGAPALAALLEQHAWSVEWAHYHCMVFNAIKSFAAGITSTPFSECKDASAEEKEAIAATAVLIDGKAVEWKASNAVDYLGTTVSLISGGATRQAMNAVSAKIHALSALIQKARLRAATAVHAVNAFVIPAIEHRLRTTQPTDEDTQKWDALVSKIVCMRAGVVMRRPLPNAAAVASISGTTLPSHALTAARITEAFVRVNGRDHCTDTIAARRELAAVLADEKAAAQEYPLGRMASAVAAMRALKWQPRITDPAQRQAVIAGGEEKKAGLRSVYREADEHAGGQRRRYVAYTDGSAGSDPMDRVCSWAVLYDGEWLDHHQHLPIAVLDEKDLSMAMFENAPLISGRIDEENAHGSYAAELRAIWEALRGAPRTCPLTIRTDSESAIRAINGWRAGDDIGRIRARKGCRPYLRLISDAMDQRALDVERSGNGDGSPAVAFEHVKAHSGIRSVEAFGNRIVDCAAKNARTASLPADRHPQLNAAMGERWMAIFEELPHTDSRSAVPEANSMRSKRSSRPSRMAAKAALVAVAATHNGDLSVTKGEAEKELKYRVVVNDIRRSAMLRLRELAVEEWRKSESQGRYATSAVGARELWQHVAGAGIPRESPPSRETTGDEQRNKRASARSTAHASAHRSPSEVGVVTYRSEVSALVLRHLTNTAQHQTLLSTRSTAGVVWKCTACEMAKAAMRERGDRHRPPAPIAITTAHLWECIAPAVCKARTDAALALTHFRQRYGRGEGQHAIAVGEVKRVQSVANDTAYLRWFRTAMIAEPRAQAGADAAAVLDGGDGKRGGEAKRGNDGTAEDAEAVAAAIGAFTARRAKEIMKGEDWRLEEKGKEWRDAAVHDLRVLCVRAMRRIWAASSQSRAPITVAAYHRAVAASSHAWHRASGDGSARQWAAERDSASDTERSGDEEAIDSIIDNGGEALTDGSAASDDDGGGVSSADDGSGGATAATRGDRRSRAHHRRRSAAVAPATPPPLRHAAVSDVSDGDNGDTSPRRSARAMRSSRAQRRGGAIGALRLNFAVLAVIALAAVACAAETAKGNSFMCDVRRRDHRSSGDCHSTRATTALKSSPIQIRIGGGGGVVMKENVLVNGDDGGGCSSMVGHHCLRDRGRVR